MAAGSAGGSVGGTVGGGGVTGGGITGGGVTGGGVTGGPAKTSRPILLLLDSVNQTLPSGPTVIPIGPPPGVRPSENSVITPSGVIRPILLPQDSVNQRLPSGPAAMPMGLLLPLGQPRLGGRGKPVITPA